MNRRKFLLTAGTLAGASALPQSAATGPANRIRSIQRLFTSEVEDKPWFYDREMWPRYLAMLAENSFNRFNLPLAPPKLAGAAPPSCYTL